MNVEALALAAPTHESLDAWLSTPRFAKCGVFFTPSESMWWPDKSASQGINWETAILCVPLDWQCWLQAALAYRMTELSQRTIGEVVSVLSRAAQARLDPLNADHMIDLRERFNMAEFSMLVSFMGFWQTCESIERRPSKDLCDAYKTLPKKKRPNNDVILRLDPEQGPFTQVEQDALHQWVHDQFCHGNLEPEHYLYLRLAMIYGLRGVQLRSIVFKDLIKTERGHQVRLFWAKQKGVDAGWREKSETFSLDEDLYNTVQAYKSIVLARLESEYAERADWSKAIVNVPLFRRNKVGRGGAVIFSVMPDLPELQALEQEPQPQFHASAGATRKWLLRMESMASFPISARTQEPLRISRGHRFRHTLGTDLSNVGLDEWSIASALMHSNTGTVRKYRQVSAELMELIDEKMSDHLALVVGAFTGTIVTDRTSAKNGDRLDRQIEDLAVCGADEGCHLDAPFTCYGCSKFQPLLGADHSSALERLEHRRAQTIIADKTTGVLWDRAILACRKVIIDCDALRKAGKHMDVSHE